MHKPVLTFGTEGSADGQFSSPFAVCTNDRGDFLVADSRIIEFRCSTVEAASSSNLAPRAPGEASSILHADWARGRIIVADAGNNRIQIFDNKGSPLLTFGSKGSGEGQFDRPWSVAVDEAGNFAVADFDNH